MRSNRPVDQPIRIAVAPAGSPRWITEAVVAGGGYVVEPESAEALIWFDAEDPKALERLLDAHPNIQWVQLPYAGIEQFVDLVDDQRMWTCGKGVYSNPVAEMALALALAGMRNIAAYSRSNSWLDSVGRSLFGANVTILGGGGITESLIRLLMPFDCHITVVRNRVQSMDGVGDVVEADRYIDTLPGADLVVLALPLTADTEGMISRTELEMMEPHAWIVNVARGRHIVTDDLVWVLRNGVIGGAALDVTEPEPLPDNHPLWSLPNCIITPHTGNTPAMGEPLLAERITSNVRRFAADQPLLGEVFPDLGY